ncbi:formate dehydrogenase subunit alpha [Oxyplasma meridianum]|uniref:Formate dehydrogenase subunit alpha n=1 Tax=Oxyplasma meridianum TaxID=3073602 RepID=A0AAX4NDI2_9ARCH
MDENNVQVNIDGKDYSINKNVNFLKFLELNNIKVPHVCYQENLGPIETCDVCIVEAEGRLTRSCSLKPVDGMKIVTDSRRVKEAQIEATNVILKNHDLYCTICENNNGDCDLHNTVLSLKMDIQKYPFKEKPYKVDETNPFYRYDPNQCILCGRCVEACQEVQVNETLSIDWNREIPRVIWDNDVPINDSSCVSCGHCVTVCPVNALMEKPMLGEAGFFTSFSDNTKQMMIKSVKSLEPFIGMGPIMGISNIESKLRESQIKKTKTVCTFCGVGCSFEMWTKGRKILKVQPSPESPANGISTCIKGKFGWDFVNSKERLTTPLIRENGKFRKATWEEALSKVASRLTEIKEKYGGDSLMFIASSKGTNEESYLVQKMARQIFHTNNVDNSSRFCQAPATTGLWRTVGYGGDSGSMRDIYESKLILIVGSNTAESHPVIATRVKRAHKMNGQKLIVADLRKHEMANRADIFLHPAPGTDLVWISAITKYIIDNKWHDTKFIEEKVNNFEAYYRSLDRFTMEFAEKTTGIKKDLLIKVAETIHQSPTMCILWAMGVTQQDYGSDTSTAISNLLLVTGNYGKPGCGSYPLRGHNNVQGASDFGAMNAYFPGYQRVDNDSARKKFEIAWNTQLPSKPGFDNNTCLEAVKNGNIKGMYVIGEELVETGSDSNFIRKRLEELDFLVVEDLFLSETASYADVVLPAAASLEKEGTFDNTERRIQRLYKVFEPVEGSRPDWEIVQDIARLAGADWNYKHPSEIMLEAASLAPIFQHVSYDRLEGFKSLQWPMNEDGTDTPILYLKDFHFPDGKAFLYPLEWRPMVTVEAEFDLHLNNGRILEHFHEGNETYKSPGISEKVPSSFLEVSPELARERGIETGDYVRVTSKYGSVKKRVLVTDRVSGKELYMPMNAIGDEGVNILTGRTMDPDSHTPSYKDLYVKIEKLKDKGTGSPLPRTNPRFGHPNPQDGVAVEKKWQRKDYKQIVED